MIQGEWTVATLKDIAAECGTSIATVSYVLSGHGEERRISAAMQERVVRAAEKLNYDIASRGRTSGRPGIAVYWPQKQMDALLPSVITGINNAISMAPMMVDVVIHPFEMGCLADQNTLWMPGRCGASVVISAADEDIAALERNKTPFPTVLLNRTAENCSSVSIDHEEAGRLAAEFAIERGGDDVTLVVPNIVVAGPSFRSRAVLDTFDDRGRKPRETIACGIEINDGYALGWKLVLDKRVPSVVLSICDTVALGISEAFKEAGFKLNEDVEIVSMSTSYKSANARLLRDLTIVDLRQVEVTTLAMNVAITLAKRGNRENRTVVLHPQMIAHL